MKKNIPVGLKIIVAANIVLAGFCVYLASLHIVSFFYFSRGVMGILLVYFFHVVFSILAFWFFAFAKLNADLNEDLIGFNYFSAFCCFIILPGYRWLLQLNAHHLEPRGVAHGFETLMISILGAFIIPSIAYCLWSIFYLKRNNGFTGLRESN